MIIPSAFYNYKQFVIYALRDKANGKKDKVPTDPTTLNPISLMDENNYLSGDEALTLAETLGDGYGVGFVFTEKDPFFFIDIDGALTDGKWSGVAQDLINRTAGAFVEVSQSGTGLHIFGNGTPPEGHANKNTELGLELYTKDRFVALTGTHAAGDANQHCDLTDLVNEYFKRDQSITERGNWTDKPRDDWDGYTDDDELIEKMLNSSLASKALASNAHVSDLWSRNVDVLADNYPDEGREFDESSADMALAQHLAFWTGCDCERMLRLMKRSALEREKWTKHKSYLKTTILSAVARQDGVMSKGGRTKGMTIEAWKDRIEAEATDAGKVGQLVNDLKFADMPRVNREMLVSMIADASKLAGHGISKTAITNTIQAERDDRIIFPDLKSSGKPKTTDQNLKALMSYYNIVARYNLMSKEVEVSIPKLSASIDNRSVIEIAALRSLCNLHDLSPTAVDEFIRWIADENAYNPPKLWIESKVWDGVNRLPDLVASLGAVPNPIYATLVKRYLISGIAAVFAPNGVGAGGMIVLQGPQYAGKTRWLRRLFGGGEWFKEGAILNPHDKDSVKQCVSHWGVELGELDATFRKSDIAALKAFITNDRDEFRLPYERSSSKFPRRTIFAGSVNPREYLHDDTGNRRFWTIEVTSAINPDHNIDIQQVWAQALELYKSGEAHYLGRAENMALNSHNEEYSSKSRWFELIGSSYNVQGELTRPMTVSEIAKELGDHKPSRRDLNEIGAAVRQLMGVESRKTNGRLVYDMPDLRSPF